MGVKTYKVSGDFWMGDRMQPFIVEARAIDEAGVKEKIYTRFGGWHKTPRKKIRFKEIKEITLDEITDPMVKALSEVE